MFFRSGTALDRSLAELTPTADGIFAFTAESKLGFGLEGFLRPLNECIDRDRPCADVLAPGLKDRHDWKEYVSHVVEADEIYVQYGCEATKELLNEIQEPTQGVIYYSIRRSDSNQPVGYIGIFEENDNIEFHIYKEHRSRSIIIREAEWIITQRARQSSI